MAGWIKKTIRSIPGDSPGTGKVRGAVLVADADYIKRIYGPQVIPGICRFAREQGYILDYDDFKPMEWYPIELRFVSLMAIKTVLNWKDDDLKFMGSKAPKYSLITRLLLRYMVDLDMLAANIQKYWDKNYSFGVIEARHGRGVFNICIKDCPTPRQVYPYLEGFFSAVIGMVVGQKNILSFGEVRWKHINGDCQEFAIRYRQ